MTLQRALAVVSLAALAAIRASFAAHLDALGFVHDGKTTYCHGVSTAQHPLALEELSVSSAGKCPIDVQISTTASIVAPSSHLGVTWSARASNSEPSTSLFPHAINSSTGRPFSVIASLLKACKVGSSCHDVVDPAAQTADTSGDTGAFGDDGVKQLRPYEFVFPDTPAEYVIVGKVVLQGDPILNISATEFFAFQHVRVQQPNVADDDDVVATVKPADTADASASGSSEGELRISRSIDNTNARVPSEQQSTEEQITKSKASAADSSNGTAVATICGAVGVVAMVGIVMAYSAYSRRQEALKEVLVISHCSTINLERSQPPSRQLMGAASQAPPPSEDAGRAVFLMSDARNASQAPTMEAGRVPRDSQRMTLSTDSSFRNERVEPTPRRTDPAMTSFHERESESKQVSRNTRPGGVVLYEGLAVSQESPEVEQQRSEPSRTSEQVSDDHKIYYASFL